jgi:hypothetical protein
VQPLRAGQRGAGKAAMDAVVADTARQAAAAAALDRAAESAAAAAAGGDAYVARCVSVAAVGLHKFNPVYHSLESA